MKSPHLRHAVPFQCGILLLASTLCAFAQTDLVTWEMTGQTGYGTQDLAPTFKDPNLTVGGLARGAGVTTINTAAANGWGGNGWDGTVSGAEAIAAENFITFTVTPSIGSTFSASTLDINYRRSSSGPSAGTLQYQIGGGSFVDITELSFSSSSSSGASITGIDLSAVAALQDVTDTVTFRLAPHTATGSGGTFYFYGPVAGNDLALKGTVGSTGGGDTNPPIIATLTPADDAVDVTLDSLATLKVLFNEPVNTGSGNILVKKVSDNSVVNTIDVTDFGQISLNGAEIELNMATPLEAGTAYYVEIPSGAILDLATPANAFPGFTGATTWNFTSAPAAVPPMVVINKYVNATPDRVELLVIGNGTPGSTVDLQGMILKDHSSNTAGDNGGSYTFLTHSAWSAVPAGTLIVLSENATTTDTNSADFVMSVGLLDETFFDVTDGGGFDVATTDMLMLKSAGSGVDGNTGGVHALAGISGAPVAGSFFTTFTGAKVRADGTSGTNAGVRVLNSTSSLGDYTSGMDAEGGVTLAAGDFGVPNSAANATYITELRGLEPGDGDGLATVINSTAASPFLNSGFFDKGQTGQSAKVILSAQTAGVTLGDITVAVPLALGTPSGATLAGTGATGANVSVVGQNVTITNAAVTTENTIEITIDGLSTPTPTLASENGNYVLAVSTSPTGGTLTPLASHPAVRVIIPIASLRDVDANGVSLDGGTVVAVEGVATEEDFGSGASNFSGFLQDATAGINVFSSSIDLGFTRGSRYAVIGTVTQFNGLTEIIPASAGGIIALGASTEPAAEVVTLATLLASPETYEGKLVQVENLFYVSGTWGSAATVVLTDSSSTNIDVRIQAGSSATAEPGYPVNVTGIVGQFDGSSPFTSGYQLMPRDAADLTPGTATGYTAWAIANGIPGEAAEDDFDNDGLSNLLEYGLGLTPAVPNGTPGALAGGVLTFTKGADAMTNGDVDWTIESSPTLGAAPSLWTTVSATEVGNTISYTLPAGQGKVFVRLVVTQL